MYQCNLLVMEIALRWVCISDFSVLNPYKGYYLLRTYYLGEKGFFIRIARVL